MTLLSRDTSRLYRQLLLWMVLLSTLSLLGCGSRTTPPPTPSPQPTRMPTATPAPLDLTIVHTNDTWGYLDPCG